MTFRKLTLTIDTNTIDCLDEIKNYLPADVDIATTTVTTRELRGTSYISKLNSLPSIPEVGIWGEFNWGEAPWEGGADPFFEDVLKIISNGSFPKPGQRENLSKPELNQLRDAIIFSTHLREKRTIFVTNDKKAFISHNRREKLESKFSTKIVTEKELRLMEFAILFKFVCTGRNWGH